jgi:excinuclease ABC subunit A
LPEVDRGARADAIEESWFEWQEGNREQCPDCHGARLNPIARAVRLHWNNPVTSRNKRYSGGLASAYPNIDFFSRASVEEAFEYFQKVKLAGREADIARDILPEINERLKFLREVGLHYLQLGRSVTTLSGGEAQRIRLAAQLGSNLSGVLYVLDEPTIGLHARDNEHLLHAIELLKNRGNTLIVVEHDEETMRRSDYVIDLGPGAGVHGGTVAGVGTLDELMANEASVTGRSLREERKFPARGTRRPVDRKTPRLKLHDARQNNLKNLTIEFPLGRFVVVTGVSGSGKSTLIRECLLPAVKNCLAKPKDRAQGDFCKVTGFESLKSVYEVDQSPVGRTPRSIPATYVGFFDVIRQLFAQTPEARLRGYSPSRFSFNSAQGRCPQCEGAGQVKLEMNFLPPAYVTCETCGGTRFNRETLDIEYRARNISHVLDLSIEEALAFFEPIPRVRRPLEALRDTGLNYLKLGQISPTLSGGEAQRMKLVTHLLSGLKEQPDLFEPPAKRNLFILEEPTIGLHMADVKRLVEVLQKLVDAGHSVIVIEHNLDLIAEADWVIDLGPEGGEQGGEIVVQGPPEQIARSKDSHTARFLKALLR